MGLGCGRGLGDGAGDEDVGPNSDRAQHTGVHDAVATLCNILQKGVCRLRTYKGSCLVLACLVLAAALRHFLQHTAEDV